MSRHDEAARRVLGDLRIGIGIGGGGSYDDLMRVHEENVRTVAFALEAAVEAETERLRSENERLRKVLMHLGEERESCG